MIMLPFQSVLPAQVRRPLCSYFSPDKEGLLNEINAAYRACRSIGSPGSESRCDQQQHNKQLLALVVPHGAACDGFFVAASAYKRLNAYLHQRRCTHLTAVLLGTEHRGATPVALSRKDWLTPLGTAYCDTAAVDYLVQNFQLSIKEAPHSTEHSIENQLPFLLHGASVDWDLAAACGSSTQQPGPAAAAAAAAGATTAATVSIVPISIGYLGNQLHLIQSVGAAVRGLIQHLKQQQQQQQQQHSQLQQQRPVSCGSSSSRSGSEVVLIVTSDFTHAGPWYRELPPAGVKLEDYMRSQDTPVLKAVQQGSVDALLSAAAATRNSMCGLYPLAVALEALYGSSSGSIGGCSGDSNVAAAALPELLDYRAAHTIFDRPDSTGFAAFAVYEK